MANPFLCKAFDIVEEVAYTELEAYDKYWDAVRTEKTLISDKARKGVEEGQELGRTLGREEGLKEGKLKMRAAGMSNDVIAEITGIVL